MRRQSYDTVVAIGKFTLLAKYYIDKFTVWNKIRYLKDAAMLSFKYSLKRYDLGLSNELLLITIAQETAKLWPSKVFVYIIS